MRTHKNLNLLILGYKDDGRGIANHAAHKEVERKLRWFRDHMIDLSDHFRSICFDDLSVRQLGLKDNLSEQAWKQLYMGGDGEFTMCEDLVKGEFAASSVKIFRTDIRSLFWLINNPASCPPQNGQTCEIFS